MRGLIYEELVAMTALLLSCVVSVSRAANWSTPMEKRPPRHGRPGLILITGLGGSCSRAPTQLLRAKGLFVPHVNGALDIHHPVNHALTYAIVNTKGGFTYEPDELEDTVRFSVRRSISRHFHLFNCKAQVCVFKEESLFALLPFYRELVARGHRQKLCVIHCAREPIQWALSHNWIGVFRWYQAFFMKSLPAKDSAQWHTDSRGEAGTLYTLDEQWIVYKSRLWSKFTEEVWNWINATRDEPLVRNFWWRCRVDNAESLVEAVLAECGAGAHVPGPTPKGENAWEADRLLEDEEMFGGKGMAEMDDPQVIRLVPFIVEHTYAMARRTGLALDDADDVHQLFKASLDVVMIMMNFMRKHRVGEEDIDQFVGVLKDVGLM